MKKNRRQGKPVILIVILILVLVFLISGLQFLESTVFHPTGHQGTHSSKTIVRDGVEYFPRQDITVIMLAGIDEYGPVQSSGSYNNTGEADMVSLLIFDETNKTMDILTLNRDTMLDMPVLGIGGKEAGTVYGQLALAHTYGTGLEDSAQNLRRTVSDFLYGVYIDYYVTMHMDAISILNDAVGGVTVTVTDDFSEIDPEITAGEYNRGRSRRSPDRRAFHQLHVFPGSHAHASGHASHLRRASALRTPCGLAHGRHARHVHLWRPFRHLCLPPDRFCHACHKQCAGSNGFKSGCRSWHRRR